MARTFLTPWRGAASMAVLAIAIGLSACASDPTRVGLGITRDAALAQAGQPTAIYPLDGGGQRLQYSRAPLGFEVTNVDLDASGHVASVTQVLDERYFSSTILVGVWREPDVLRAYGRPGEISRVTSFNGTVWQWRYKQNNMPRFLYIYLDPQGVVQRYHVGDDFSNERRRR